LVYVVIDRHAPAQAIWGTYVNGYIQLIDPATGEIERKLTG
jgi:hypothetical protein